MKKRHIIISIAAVILCIFLLCAGIFAFPLLRAARALQRIAEAECVNYKLNITFNQERISDKQEQFLRFLSRIFEVEESSCMSWSVKGYLSGGKGYAEVSCAGLQGPVMDVYFGEDYAVVNVRMLYEALQDNFSGAHPFLGALLPEWKYSEYISLEQVEEIFDVDIRDMYQPYIPEKVSGGSIWKGLLMLGRMERKKGADGRLRFEMEENGCQTGIEIGKAKETAEIFLQGMDAQKNQVVISYEASVSSAPKRETVYPDSVMEQDEIIQFRNLWDIVKGIQGRFRKEQ